MSDARTTLGHGIGLRAKHFDSWQHHAPDVAWAECITENFLGVGGRPRQVLERVRSLMPVVLHGVSLSIGSVDPLNLDYLAAVKQLAHEVEPSWVSDHLCWSSVGGQYLHDLLPLPYTEEALAHVASRVHEVQEMLQRPLVLENPSTYLAFDGSTMAEWEFFAELVRATGCGMLLDVNNVYVSARNQGFSPETYLDGIPREAVWQFHLAGHSDLGTHLIDTHDAPVCDDVWRLYAAAVRRFGPLPALVEWDDAIPPLAVLVDESRRAAAVEHDAVSLATAGP